MSEKTSVPSGGERQLTKCPKCGVAESRAPQDDTFFYYRNGDIQCTFCSHMWRHDQPTPAAQPDMDCMIPRICERCGAAMTKQPGSVMYAPFWSCQSCGSTTKVESVSAEATKPINWIPTDGCNCEQCVRAREVAAPVPPKCNFCDGNGSESCGCESVVAPSAPQQEPSDTIEWWQAHSAELVTENALLREQRDLWIARAAEWQMQVPSPRAEEEKEAAGKLKMYESVQYISETAIKDILGSAAEVLEARQQLSEKEAEISRLTAERDEFKRISFAESLAKEELEAVNASLTQALTDFNNTLNAVMILLNGLIYVEDKTIIPSRLIECDDRDAREAAAMKEHILSVKESHKVTLASLAKGEKA